ncbi:hypothetical protein Q7P37_010036 [Cladosporium fusiforme]
MVVANSFLCTHELPSKSRFFFASSSMMTKIRVLIIGGGGVGAMAAYALQTGGQADVTLVLRSNYDSVSRNGFTIDSVQHGKIEKWVPSQITQEIPSLDKHNPFDYILLATKNVPEIKPTVVDLIRNIVEPGKTSVLLLQNGLNIELPLIHEFPSNVILSGVSLISATEKPQGHIQHDYSDSCKIGPFSTLSSEIPPVEAESSAKRLIAAYNTCGVVDWSYDDDVKSTRWRKLLYNSSFNSVAAVTGLDTPRMRMSEHVIDDLILPIMHELRAVAKAAGVELPEGAEEKTVRIDPVDTAFLPSMGQDAAKGNFMEIENIVGEPVREANRLNVPAPKLETMYGLLKAMQLRVKERKGLWTAEFADGAKYA